MILDSQKDSTHTKLADTVSRTVSAIAAEKLDDKDSVTAFLKDGCSVLHTVYTLICKLEVYCLFY